MKVYIVMYHTWEYDKFLGVFSSIDKAKAYIKNKYPHYQYDETDITGRWVNPDGDTIDIETAVLDKGLLYGYI